MWKQRRLCLSLRGLYQQCRDIVEEAGFLCAVTTEGGKAKPGDGSAAAAAGSDEYGAEPGGFSVYGGARGVKGWGFRKGGAPNFIN